MLHTVSMLSQSWQILNGTAANEAHHEEFWVSPIPLPYGIRVKSVPQGCLKGLQLERSQRQMKIGIVDSLSI